MHSQPVFFAVPRVPWGEADKETGPVAPYGQIKPELLFPFKWAIGFVGDKHRKILKKYTGAPEGDYSPDDPAHSSFYMLHIVKWKGFNIVSNTCTALNNY